MFRQHSGARGFSYIRAFGLSGISKVSKCILRSVRYEDFAPY
jgi:hypothetical protein